MSRSDFYHVNPINENNFDLDAMWNARQQFVNILVPSGSSTLFLTVINFDPSYRKANVSYTITIDGPSQHSYQCENCLNHGAHGPNGCYCVNCGFDTFGKICSRAAQKISSNSTTVTLNSLEYQYFTL